MILYTVELTPIGRGNNRVLRGVKGDGWMPDNRIRFLILEDETRIEYPAAEFITTFSPERWSSVCERMATEAKQPMPVEKR